MKPEPIAIDFEAAFEAMPGYSALVSVDDPRFTILATTNSYGEPSARKKEDLIGRGLLEAFPENPESSDVKSGEQLRKSFRKVIALKKTDGFTYRYDTMRKGTFEETHWEAVNAPVLDGDGNVRYIIHTAEDITQKIKNKSQRKKLKGLQQAYNLFMQAPEGICILQGEKMTVEMANAPILEMWGKDQKVIGKPLLKALPEIEGQGFIELLENVRATEVPYSATQTPVVLNRNGRNEVVYFDFTYQPYFDDDQTAATGVIVFGSEVTEKVEAAKVIQENEARYRMLIEEATVATALYIGRELRIQYVNDIMTGYWGKDSSVIGKTLLEAIPELKDQRFLKLLDDVLTTGKPYIGTGEMALLNLDGELKPYYFNFTYKPLRNADGEIYAIHHMAVDVTEAIITMKKAEENEQKYRELSMSLEQKVEERTAIISQLIETFQYAEQTGKFGSYHYDFDTKKLSYSDNFYRLLGCEPGEFPADPEEYMKFVHPEDRDLVRLASHDALEKHKITSWEYRIIRKDGKMTCVRGTANIVRDIKGKTHMIGTLQDINDEKHKEHLLKEKNESLSTMNKELESFAYISSHDLQEPLRKIQTFASRILDSEHDKLSGGAQAYFERIQNAALRMQTLIDDLLAYSRTNSEERRFEKVDLADIVEEIKEEIHEDLQVYHATIKADKLCEVRIIPFQFRQLMHNLIGNALKFSRHERSPRITIKSENGLGAEFHCEKLMPHEKYCHISVSDNGIGFDPEYGEKIFEVFQRLHSKDRYSGTGIGLAIVKKIVENHHGVITAHGELNKGATFDMYIPSIQE